ncbi:GNAT family N-acetyltransferase [Tetragenococcus halophilus]|nr:GNAT family N-acetyltransferase [Tetragenococcus halophilus]
MKTKGVTQWDENYPNSSVIKKDIQQKILWLYGEKEQACVTVEVKENTVDIHRLVVNSLYKEQGLAKLILQDILDWASINKQIEQVKITTNHTNQGMLKLLLAKEFVPIRSFKIKGRANYGSFIELSRKL